MKTTCGESKGMKETRKIHGQHFNFMGKSREIVSNPHNASCCY